MPQKEAVSLSSVFDYVRDLFNPEARRAKQDIKIHLESNDPKKWESFEQKAKSPEFVRQLEKMDDVSKKDILFARNIGALDSGRILGQVDSARQSGTQYQIKQIPGGLGCTCNDWKYRGSVNPGYKCKHIEAYMNGRTKVASLAHQTAAFFDELRRIEREKRKEIFKDRRDEYSNTAGPYSDLLVPGGTLYYNSRPANLMDDPEVILGGSFVR